MRFLALIFCFAISCSEAGNLVSSDQDLTQVNLGNRVRFLEDPHGHLGIEQLLASPNEFEWQPNHSERLNFGITNSAYWLKVELENEGIAKVNWLLRIAYPLLDHIDVYDVHESGTIKHWQAGDTLPLSVRAFNHRHFIFPLELGGAEHTDIYIRIATEGTMQIPLSLWSELWFYSHEHESYVMHGVFFGIFMVMILYNLFLYLSVRDLSFLYYVLFASGFLLFLVALSGYGYQHVWSNSPQFQRYSIIIFICLSSIFIGKFTQHFLSIKPEERWPYRGILFVMAGGFITPFVALTTSYGLGIKILMLWTIASCIVCSAIGIHYWLRKGEMAKIYTLSWVMVGVGVSTVGIMKLGIANDSSLMDYILPVTASFQALMLSFALGYRIQAERAHRMRAERDVLQSQTELLKAKLKGKEIASESERIKIEAEAESKAKNEFLAMMSHEIRTPLNGIMGMSDLLRSSHLEDQQRRFVNTIYSSGESLLTIINDILDFSKIQAGKLDIESIPINLFDFVEDCTSIFSSKIRDKQLILTAEIQPHTPIYVQSDPVRLRQVVLNYLSNAIKFTDAGHISLVLSVDVTTEQLKIEVTDTGLGISEENQRNLFESFSQADSSTTRKFGGTGLGLAICKRLSELMGGRTGVKSAMGQGSTFWFTCKVDVLEERTADLVQVKDFNVGLLVAHNAEQSWLAKHLNTWGASTITLHESQIQSRNAPKLSWLIIDNEIVKKSSLAEAANFYQLAEERIITLDDFDEKAKLNRPLNTSSLYNVLSAQPLSQIENQYTVNHDNDMPLNGTRILVAEDNQVNQMVIDALLKKLGAEPKLVENGEQAVAEVQEHADDYDLVLMDCEMPVMDGFEATKRIRELEQSAGRKGIPIIALTAHAMDSHRQQALSAGMNKFITKPVKRTELLQAISDILSQDLLAQL